MGWFDVLVLAICAVIGVALFLYAEKKGPGGE